VSNKICRERGGQSPGFCSTALYGGYSQAMVSVLAVKDRVLGHNPLAVIYTYHYYYERFKEDRRKQVTVKNEGEKNRQNKRRKRAA